MIFHLALYSRTCDAHKQRMAAKAEKKEADNAANCPKKMDIVIKTG